MRYATVADVVAALAKPPLTETQILPASNRDEARLLVLRMAAKRDREAAAMERAQTEDALAADLASLFRVLRTRDNLPVSEDHIRERVANGLAGLLGNYRIERLP